MSSDAEFEEEVKKVDRKFLETITDENIIRGKIRRRAGKRQSLTKTLKKIEAMPTPISELDAKFFYTKIKDLSRVISELDEEIEGFMLTSDDRNDEDVEKNFEISESYSDIAIRALNCLENLLAEMSAPRTDSSRNNSISTPQTNVPKLKLPQIDLPKFSNEPEDFDQFRNCLNDMFSKFSLTEYEKYMHLMQCTSGNARKIVESVPSGDVRYSNAMSLLEKAYSCIISQQFSVIAKILKLKLTSSKTSLEWISRARILNDQMRRLGITSQTFMQYFLWDGMDDSFKRQYIHITSSSKPSLDNILEHSFAVFDRMNEVKEPKSVPVVSEKNKFPPNTVALATNVAHKSSEYKPNKSCWLCCESMSLDSVDHKIQNCPKFKSAEEKLSEINRHNACVKCGFKNHTVDKCRYRFSGRCVKCRKYHAYFLCTYSAGNETASASGNNQSRNRRKNVDTQNVSTNVISLSVMNTTMNSDNIIPTFTTSFEPKLELSLRCMYDPAAQASFITKNAFDRLKCPVIRDNIDINIMGFNESKAIKTKLVRLKSNMNGCTRYFDAFVVPKISSSIKGDFVPIIEAFKKAGIPLADRSLGRSNKVDILLGVDAAHVLPVHACTFGEENKHSIVYHTCVGVMIAGNISRLHENLSHLHLLKSFISKFNSTF